MQKFISLSLVGCLTLCGCGVFRRSNTWATVTSARTRIDTRAEADPSRAYATHLSKTLASASVEHKVVTYQYRYRTRLREEAIGTRTAVIYRDNTNRKNPWWLMDEQLRKPVWLPGQDLNKQVAFYLRDDAEIVETRDVHGSAENKSMLAMSRKTNSQPVHELEATGIVRLLPVRKTDRSQILIARAPMKRPASAQMPLFAADRPLAWLRPARFAPVSSAPAFTPVPVPFATESFAAIFRSRHGTAFDPASIVDRRKMDELHHAGASGIF